MSDPVFFGYGSLVNTATHAFSDPRPASLPGWRRVWRATNLREAAFLSVERHVGAQIHGLVAQVPGNDWTKLDQREAAYIRQDVTGSVLHNGPSSRTAIYQIADEHLAPTGDHPILLSYLDVVIQGYLRVYGHQGVEAFFDTTDGWHLPVKDDRAAPIYPRHQVLTAAEHALVDRYLAAMV
ncbi:gamma-glutamylcyclotransferase family protein [Yoonia sp. 2307UL14-13]|uniref:gamma-glutamylcyclotransferase family protein n=1 Tax=Yoonia sp. 2307UL14-13 TaxID=3126506 RepID=UPI0030B0CE8E